MDTDGQTQLLTCSGADRDGSVRIVRSGIGIEEQASIELPGIKAMWSMPKAFGDAHHTYLVQVRPVPPSPPARRGVPAAHTPRRPRHRPSLPKRESSASRTTRWASAKSRVSTLPHEACSAVPSAVGSSSKSLPLAPAWSPALTPWSSSTSGRRPLGPPSPWRQAMLPRFAPSSSSPACHALCSRPAPHPPPIRPPFAPRTRCCLPLAGACWSTSRWTPMRVPSTRSGASPCPTKSPVSPSTRCWLLRPRGAAPPAWRRKRRRGRARVPPPRPSLRRPRRTAPFYARWACGQT